MECEAKLACGGALAVDWPAGPAGVGAGLAGKTATGKEKKKKNGGGAVGLREEKEKQASGLIRERGKFPFLFYFQNEFKCKPNQI